MLFTSHEPWPQRKTLELISKVTYPYNFKVMIYSSLTDITRISTNDAMKLDEITTIEIERPCLFWSGAFSFWVTWHWNLDNWFVYRGRNSKLMAIQSALEGLVVLSAQHRLDFAMSFLSNTQNCGLRIRREYRERFPHHRLQRKLLVSESGMHHGMCVTHVPWCMSGSLTRVGRENVPDIPGACTTCNFTYLARGPLHGQAS